MDDFFRRFAYLIFGLFLYALGIVFTMKAHLGFAPWEVLHWGLGNAMGMSIGNVSILTGLVICLIVVIMREKLGFGTILNMFLIGKFIDILLSIAAFPQMTGWISGVLMLFLGLFTIAFGSYFYINSAFGAGPRDSLMVLLTRKTQLPIGVCRGILEAAVVFSGWLLGGPVGLGTVIAAFGISFCVQIVFNLVGFEATSIKHETLDVTFKKMG